MSVQRRHAGTASPVSPSRPRELQDGLNRWLYHPLAWRLAISLSATPITPNAVSVAGAAIVVMAGLSYIGLSWPFGALLGLLLHMTWHVVDGADGDLARLTGRSSPRGELVDGICDYASHLVLYLLLGFQLQHFIGVLAWLPTIAAGGSRIVQANRYEAQRREYQWWAYGVPWLRHSRQDGAGTTPTGMVGGLSRAYLALADATAPKERSLDTVLAEVGTDPASLSRARQIVRANAATLLPRSPLLGANYRTIGLGLSMLAGSPLWYFLYEAVILNIVLAWSWVRVPVAERAVATSIVQAFASTRR
ncbi:CDP-alcohol phosphatidyltransferase family protein [Novosphingobium sp. 9]|uniref:CDP-alcohol phosphatidyltransferase family protein n=1 Tax=Novosphingobium sp. 9 TaxID=2025349 RepID=UPI0021B592D2|nr:CDP-alcohol phosphatidyltransferase family protein [Novosphingobium sp. 9]